MSGNIIAVRLQAPEPLFIFLQFLPFSIRKIVSYVQPFCPPGWSWSGKRELHAASQWGRSLRKGEWGQHDRQPIPPAGQETQSEEEEMSHNLTKLQTSSLLQQRCVWMRFCCWLFVYWLASNEDRFFLLFFFIHQALSLKRASCQFIINNMEYPNLVRESFFKLSSYITVDQRWRWMTGALGKGKESMLLKMMWSWWLFSSACLAAHAHKSDAYQFEYFANLCYFFNWPT